MLYICNILYAACVFVDWVDKLVSFERAAKRNENDYSKCPLHLLLCCLLRVAPHRASLCHYAANQFTTACGKRTRGNVLACCNTPAKRLYLEKLFQYLHFLLLQLSCPYRNLWVVRLFTHIYVYICWPCTNNTHHHHHQATAALTTTTITSTATTRRDRADCLSIDWQMSI